MISKAMNTSQGILQNKRLLNTNKDFLMQGFSYRLQSDAASIVRRKSGKYHAPD